MGDNNLYKKESFQKIHKELLSNHPLTKGILKKNNQERRREVKENTENVETNKLSNLDDTSELERFISSNTYDERKNEIEIALYLRQNPYDDSINLSLQRKKVIIALIETQKRHIDQIQYVIENYYNHFTKNRNVKGTPTDIKTYFGNIEQLKDAAKKLLERLEKCNNSVELISHVFLLGGEEIFKVYQDFMKFISQSEKTYYQHVTDQKIDLNLAIDCRATAVNIFNRLSKFPLLLGELQTEAGSGNHSKAIEDAIKLIVHKMNEINTSIAIDQIYDCKEVDLTKMGSLVLKQNFKVGEAKKRKKDMTLLLFEGYLVYSVEEKENQKFKFIFGMLMQNVTIVPSIDQGKETSILKITNFTKGKDCGKVYEIEGDAYVCEIWKRKIKELQ